MRRIDDNSPEALAERHRAFLEWQRTHEANVPRKPIAPLIRRVPTHEDLERMREILRGEEPGK